jgi:hypothetical protein
VSVAVPVFSRGEVVCSLNTAGPESRCSSRTWVKNARLALQDASRNLTDSLEVWAAGPVPNNNHSDDDHSDNDSDDKDSKR